jgi:myotubularin-related protein 9
VIGRCSQPLLGPNNRRSREDEKVLAAFNIKSATRAGAKKGYIIDTRTQATINSAKAKGGGQEIQSYYPGWKKINKSIDRYHFLLDSYSKLMEACSDTSTSHEKWLNRLTISSWLTHVKDILNCGCLIAQCVEQV